MRVALPKFNFGSRTRPAEAELARLEERLAGLQRAENEWLGLLRDMEDNGETHSRKYDSYYTAYLDTRQQRKLADVQLFNYRRGLTA